MKTYTELELVKLLRERAGKLDQKRLSEQLGFSPQFINDVLARRRDVSESLARSLGFTKMEARFFRTPKQ